MTLPSSVALLLLAEGEGLVVLRFTPSLLSESLDCYLGTGEDDVGARALYEGLGFSHRGGHATGPVHDFYERAL